MCGIVGIVDRSARPVDGAGREGRMERRAVAPGVLTTRAYLVHDRVGLGMRRLSITNITGGGSRSTTRQVRCGRYSTAEIYNYDELREELQQRGAITLHAERLPSPGAPYEEYGEAGVSPAARDVRLRPVGRATSRLIVARDRLGSSRCTTRSRWDRFFASGSKRSPGTGFPGTSTRRVSSGTWRTSLCAGAATIFRMSSSLRRRTTRLRERTIAVHCYWTSIYEADRAYRRSSVERAGLLQADQKGLDPCFWTPGP